jgi:hypothetical protein
MTPTDLKTAVLARTISDALARAHEAATRVQEKFSGHIHSIDVELPEGWVGEASAELPGIAVDICLGCGEDQQAQLLLRATMSCASMETAMSDAVEKRIPEPTAF